MSGLTTVPVHATTATQQRTADHVWMHFAPPNPEPNSIPVLVRGEGNYVFDEYGKRYLDGLAGLFTVQIGHGRSELAEAAATQMRKLAYFPQWGFANEPAAELAERLCDYAPGDLNRVFFTNSGSESVETAWKLAKNYFQLTGAPQKHKVLSRTSAYHGTTHGALSITGVPALKTPFEPLVPSTHRIPNTNFYRAKEMGFTPTNPENPASTGSANGTANTGSTSNPGNSATNLDAQEQFGIWAADAIESAIIAEGPDSVAAVFLEPVQNSGGCFTPPPGYFQRVQEICRRHNVLLVSDEVICAFGRLGEYFGATRYQYQPDIITTAKGITSGYSPMGAVFISDRIHAAFAKRDTTFLHGYTFGGHPASAAVALANLTVMENEQLPQRVLDKEAAFLSTLRKLEDLNIVGEVRGAGYFYGIELVKDKATKETFSAEESQRVLKDFISHSLFDNGLYCRADDRQDPVIQLAPPLTCGEEEFALMESIIRDTLTQAQELI